MKSQQLFIVAAVLVIGAVLVAFILNKSGDKASTANITNFEECKNAGYPIMESYPEQCRTPAGESFVRVIDTSIGEPEPMSTGTSFAKPTTVERGSQITFSDGLTLTLTEINDSRCPADAQCIWAGELSASLTATGGSFEDSTQLIRLGTVNDSSATVQTYDFTLNAATETSVTVTVSKSSQPPVVSSSETGTIQGRVTIGPICSVVREGFPCEVPVETYTSRNVMVYGSDRVTVIKKVALDTNGNYSLVLMPGKYWVQIQPAGIGLGEMKSVTVNAGEATTLDFDIDTGIR